MRSIILFALIVAVCLASPMKTYEEEGMLKFDLDVHQDSPIGLMMKGQLNPQNESQNKIAAFLKLANHYIPILESLANQNGELTWTRTWRINFLGFNFDIIAYFQLIVGWRVFPGGYTTDRFDVTYTPFAWGFTSGSINGTSWPAVGSSSIELQYLHAEAPISVRLYRQGRFCFQGSYAVQPVHLRHKLYAALNECYDEIFDDLINGHTIFQWTCNYTNPVNVTIIDNNFTDPIIGNVIDETCISW